MYKELKVLTVPSPQDLCWASAALSLCSAPDTACECHCPALCGLLLFEDCLPVSRFLHHEDWLMCVTEGVPEVALNTDVCKDLKLLLSC